MPDPRHLAQVRERLLELAVEDRASSSLYTPALRRRTLAAVAAGSQGHGRITVPLTLMSLLGVIVSFAVPLWIHALAFTPVVGSAGLALILGFSAFYLVGGLLAALLAFSLPQTKLQVREVLHV